MISAGDTGRVGGVSTPQADSPVIYPSAEQGYTRSAIQEMMLRDPNIRPLRLGTSSERFERWRMGLARFAPSWFGFVPINQRKPGAYDAFQEVRSQGGALIYYTIDESRMRIVVAGEVYDLASFYNTHFNSKFFSLGDRVKAIGESSPFAEDSLYIPGAASEIDCYRRCNPGTNIYEISIGVATPLYRAASIFKSLRDGFGSALRSFEKLDYYEIEIPVEGNGNIATALRAVLHDLHSSDAREIRALVNKRYTRSQFVVGREDRSDEVSVGVRLNPEGRVRKLVISIRENDARGFLNRSVWEGTLVEHVSTTPWETPLLMVWGASDSDLHGKEQEQHVRAVVHEMGALWRDDVGHVVVSGEDRQMVRPPVQEGASDAARAARESGRRVIGRREISIGSRVSRTSGRAVRGAIRCAGRVGRGAARL